MKLLNRIYILVLFICPSFIYAQDWYAGAEGSYLMPVSSLGVRFKPAPAFAVYFGKEVSENWKWTGKVELFRFDRINRDNYFIKRKIQLNNTETDVSLPLQDTTMELSVIGISADADYFLLRTDFIQISADFGFGIYRWESTLGSFYDTLYYNNNSDQIIAEVLKVPSVKQLDWSGGFSIGVNIDVHITGPLWFNTGLSYKNIIGELWAVLSLDMDNVSTFQMIQGKAGVYINL